MINGLDGPGMSGSICVGLRSDLGCVAMEQFDRAPDFAGRYPSAGVMIGPAWQRVWSALADGEWRRVKDLAADPLVLGGVRPNTIRALIFKAVTYWVIEREIRVGTRPASAPGQRSAWVRRHDH